METVKEFLGMVLWKTAEEVSRAGRGMGITVLCMVAFFCIALGIYLNSRCALMYYIMPAGKKKFLGSLYIREVKGGFQIKVPGHFLEQSESIYYFLKIPAYFAGNHYMEEMKIELPSGKKRLAIKKQLTFQVNLY